METRVIVEEPLIVLQSSCSYSNEHDFIEIYAAELKAAEVGKRWVADYCDNGRANECESLEVVYKTAKGIVFYVDNTQAHGWAVALTQSENKKWWDQNREVTAVPDSWRAAIRELDGYANTQDIRNRGDSQTYPAAYSR